MILKNAGLKSKEEAMHRMIDGEVFYECRDVSLLHIMEGDTQSAFVIRYSDGELAHIKGLWGVVEAWQVEVKWQDTLKDKPVLCWVSDGDEESRSWATRIVCYREGEEQPYADCDSIKWEYATPVSPNECLGE